MVLVRYKKGCTFILALQCTREVVLEPQGLTGLTNGKTKTMSCSTSRLLYNVSSWDWWSDKR
jgi:hypothetical protein